MESRYSRQVLSLVTTMILCIPGSAAIAQRPSDDLSGEDLLHHWFSLGMQYEGISTLEGKEQSIGLEFTGITPFDSETTVTARLYEPDNPAKTSFLQGKVVRDDRAIEGYLVEFEMPERPSRRYRFSLTDEHRDPDSKVLWVMGVEEARGESFLLHPELLPEAAQRVDLAGRRNSPEEDFQELLPELRSKSRRDQLTIAKEFSSTFRLDSRQDFFDPDYDLILLLQKSSDLGVRTLAGRILQFKAKFDGQEQRLAEIGHLEELRATMLVANLMTIGLIGLLDPDEDQFLEFADEFWRQNGESMEWVLDKREEYYRTWSELSKELARLNEMCFQLTKQKSGRSLNDISELIEVAFVGDPKGTVELVNKSKQTFHHVGLFGELRWGGPIPSINDAEILNARIQEALLNVDDEVILAHQQSIEELISRDLSAFVYIPILRPGARLQLGNRANRDFLMRLQSSEVQVCCEEFKGPIQPIKHLTKFQASLSGLYDRHRPEWKWEFPETYTRVVEFKHEAHELSSRIREADQLYKDGNEDLAISLLQEVAKEVEHVQAEDAQRLLEEWQGIGPKGPWDPGAIYKGTYTRRDGREWDATLKITGYTELNRRRSSMAQLKAHREIPLDGRFYTDKRAIDGHRCYYREQCKHPNNMPKYTFYLIDEDRLYGKDSAGGEYDLARQNMAGGG